MCLLGQVRDILNVVPREEMKFLIVEPGDIGDRVLDAGSEVLLPCIIEHIYLHYGHVDAAQQLRQCGPKCPRRATSQAQRPARF